MRSLQAAQILTLSVILSCITTSTYACPCALKHPQYHYCVSEYVFRAVILEFAEVLKVDVDNQPEKPLVENLIQTTTQSPPTTTTLTPMMTTDQETMETDLIMTTETEQINSTLSTENSSLINDNLSEEVEKRETTITTTETPKIFPKLSFEGPRQHGGKLLYVEPSSLFNSYSDISSDISSDVDEAGMLPDYSISGGVVYQYPQDYYIRYRVKVTKDFKGTLDEGHTIDIFTLADLSDCGMRHLVNATSYLFAISQLEDGRMFSTNCDWVIKYDELTVQQKAGLKKTYRTNCKKCNNAESCGNNPMYTECNNKYSSCVLEEQIGCTWSKSQAHLSCRLLQGSKRPPKRFPEKNPKSLGF
ncbi:uncharacterized protein [Antedon mediterranea]|uniref:uncharacterized protein n=1 Tax=Antedon mediterranea TaxID=105859 RepID=UPI003AF561A2